MKPEEINKTLAGIEGKALHSNNRVVTYINDMCQTCGEHKNNHAPNYLTDIAACLRVARKMGVTTAQEVWIDDGYTVSVTQGYGYNVATVRIVATDPGNPASTLAPMLAEIAKKESTNGDG